MNDYVNAIKKSGSKILEEFSGSWNNPDRVEAAEFRGKVIGYVIAEILLAIFSGGILTEIKWISTALAKMGKAGQFLMELINTVRKGMGKGKMARKVGLILENVEDVMVNPKLLEGKKLLEIRYLLKDTKGWINDVMRKSKTNPNGGWMLREVNKQGSDFTGRMIQYHPGTPRHFDGKPYWKVSSGSGTYRFIASS